MLTENLLLDLPLSSSLSPLLFVALNASLFFWLVVLNCCFETVEPFAYDEALFWGLWIALNASSISVALIAYCFWKVFCFLPNEEPRVLRACIPWMLVYAVEYALVLVRKNALWWVLWGLEVLDRFRWGFGLVLHMQVFLVVKVFYGLTVGWCASAGLAYAGFRLRQEEALSHVGFRFGLEQVFEV